MIVLIHVLILYWQYLNQQSDGLVIGGMPIPPPGIIVVTALCGLHKNDYLTIDKKGAASFENGSHCESLVLFT